MGILNIPLVRQMPRSPRLRVMAHQRARLFPLAILPGVLDALIAEKLQAQFNSVQDLISHALTRGAWFLMMIQKTLH